MSPPAERGICSSMSKFDHEAQGRPRPTNVASKCRSVAVITSSRVTAVYRAAHSLPRVEAVETVVVQKIGGHEAFHTCHAIKALLVICPCDLHPFLDEGVQNQTLQRIRVSLVGNVECYFSIPGRWIYSHSVGERVPECRIFIARHSIVIVKVETNQQVLCTQALQHRAHITVAALVPLISSPLRSRMPLHVEYVTIDGKLGALEASNLPGNLLLILSLIPL